MKIINGQDTILGRLASYAAKEALRGEEIIVVNCEKVIITGSRKNIEGELHEKRHRHGHSQKGPKPSKLGERIVKRTIRGMLPNHRFGRGREAWKRIKCYTGIPKEFEGKKMEKVKSDKKSKFVRIENVSKISGGNK
jgi:large subunit ribosomal protein L13